MDRILIKLQQAILALAEINLRKTEKFQSRYSVFSPVVEEGT
jgi:hypothetical protein